MVFGFKKKSKKKLLIDEFKNILSALYTKIIIVDSVTFDPGFTLKVDKDEKYSEFYEVVLPFFKDWAADEKLTPNETNFLQKLLAEDKNPIINDVINLSQFLKSEDSIDQKTMRILRPLVLQRN